MTLGVGEAAATNDAETARDEGEPRFARDTPRAPDSTSVAASVLLRLPSEMESAILVCTAATKAAVEAPATLGMEVEAATAEASTLKTTSMPVVVSSLRKLMSCTVAARRRDCLAMMSEMVTEAGGTPSVLLMASMSVLPTSAGSVATVRAVPSALAGSVSATLTAAGEALGAGVLEGVVEGEAPRARGEMLALGVVLCVGVLEREACAVAEGKVVRVTVGEVVGVLVNEAPSALGVGVEVGVGLVEGVNVGVGLDDAARGKLVRVTVSVGVGEGEGEGEGVRVSEAPEALGVGVRVGVAAGDFVALLEGKRTGTTTLGTLLTALSLAAARRAAGDLDVPPVLATPLPLRGTGSVGPRAFLATLALPLPAVVPVATVPFCTLAVNLVFLPPAATCSRRPPEPAPVVEELMAFRLLPHASGLEQRKDTAMTGAAALSAVGRQALLVEVGITGSLGLAPAGACSAVPVGHVGAHASCPAALAKPSSQGVHFSLRLASPEPTAPPMPL